LLSILAGITAGIFTEVMKFFHLTTITSTLAISMMFIREGSLSLGFLAAAGFAMVVGLIVYYSAKILGTDYFPIKACLLRCSPNLYYL
jgi:uncharacterized oligopeptide transporter (OPT) family protein